MDITSSQMNFDSDAEFSKHFMRLVDSGAGVIQVRAHEILRATTLLRKTILLDNGIYKEWDIVHGTREFLTTNFTDEAVPGDNNIDIATSFSAPLGGVNDASSSGENIRYYVYVNAHMFIENNPHMQQLMLLYNEYLPTCRTCVIMVGPDEPLPESLASSSILSVRMATPGISELRRSLDLLVDSYGGDFKDGATLTEEEANRVCYAGAGMSLLQFETYVSLAAVKASRDGKTSLVGADIEQEVRVGKTDIVNSSDILELYPSANINDVGGMENLKNWVSQRAKCYSDEAKEFGVEAPKGIVLVGVPGSGKSLVAKSIAGELGVPLVRMDFGRVFSSLVGSSEQRIRTALRMVESMSPCVLFCDELDKGLGGIASGSGGDSGVSMRVLGSFLTWLQDCKYPVFTMVTANNVDGLPPELLRRGRFDAIFSTSMPTEQERKEVLGIHLRKRGRDIEEFNDEDIARFVDVTNRYVPAEIESAVKDGLVDAFSRGEELSMQHIIDAILVMVPLSKAFAPQIKRMEDWAAQNATPVSYTEEQKRNKEVVSKNRVRNTHRRRKG